jgi:hypothetical protein
LKWKGKRVVRSRDMMLCSDKVWQAARKEYVVGGGEGGQTVVLGWVGDLKRYSAEEGDVGGDAEGGRCGDWIRDLRG